MSENPKRRQAKTPEASPTPAPPASPPEAAAPSPDAPTQSNSNALMKANRSPTKVTELPPFRVVLHDDEHVEMTYVVRSIVELTPLSAPLARDVMLNAHEHGCCSMLVTHQERAELYQEQFANKGLTVTIEPAA
jgi:ATP-dependent Clp protease adaptor protein ClpS